MEVVTFRWEAKYGHFLMAGANRNCLTYPVPPRTAVLGLLAAILGLEKDDLASVLGSTWVAVTGAPPLRFWHTVKLRQDDPERLPYMVKSSALSRKLRTAGDPKLIPQEVLWKPSFRVHVSVPEDRRLFAEIAGRIKDRRWHYGPCMGLSEFLAEVVHESTGKALQLPAGRHEVIGLCKGDAVRLKAGNGIAVRLLKMPRNVTNRRVFEHSAYYLEHAASPIPVETEHAWQIGQEMVVFM